MSFVISISTFYVQIVRGRVKVQCKCHGMSGSCELKTCWKVAPPFREVGAIIKQKYDKATKVKVNSLSRS